jgi:hypothetical protein
MRLPNGHRAIVPIQKLVEYCLNPDHPRGKHKAKVFSAACGISASNARILQQALIEAAANSDAKPAETDQYGQRFVIDFEIEGLVGRVPVRSLWIIITGENVPRLTSCFVL